MTDTAIITQPYVAANAKARRAHLITETNRLSLMADDRGKYAEESLSAARDQAKYRIRFHALSAELLALTPTVDTQASVTQRDARIGHLEEAEHWKRRLASLGGEG